MESLDYRHVIPPLFDATLVSREIGRTVIKFDGRPVICPRPDGLVRHESKLLRGLMTKKVVRLTMARAAEVATFCELNAHLIYLLIDGDYIQAYFVPSLETIEGVCLVPVLKPLPKPARKYRGGSAGAAKTAERWKRVAIRAKDPAKKKEAWTKHARALHAAKPSRPRFTPEQAAELKRLTGVMGSRKAHLSKAAGKKRGLLFSGRKHTTEYKLAAQEVALWRPLYEKAYAEYREARERFTRELAATTGP